MCHIINLHVKCDFVFKILIFGLNALLLSRSIKNELKRLKSAQCTGFTLVILKSSFVSPVPIGTIGSLLLQPKKPATVAEATAVCMPIVPIVRTCSRGLFTSTKKKPGSCFGRKRRVKERASKDTGSINITYTHGTCCGAERQIPV